MCVYMRDEVCSVTLTLLFSGDEIEFYSNNAVFMHLSVGEWGRSTEGGHPEVSGSHRWKCHHKVGRL